MTKPTKYRFVGAHVDDLADGRTLVPGETYTLDPDQVDDPHNKRHIDAGTLLEVEHAKTAARKESD